MKKFLLSAAVAATGMLMLSSCIDNGTSTSTGVAYGITKLSTDVPGIVVTDDYATLSGGLPVYASAFQSMAEGKCVAYAYEVDYNSQSSTSYVAVTATQTETFDQFPSTPSITDTKTALTGEYATSSLDLSMYSDSYIFRAGGYVFLTSTHSGIKADQSNNFDLSYDMSVEPSMVGSNRVYELYFRAQKTKDGSKAEQTGSYVNTFSLKNFFKAAAAKEGKDATVFFRINYVTGISGNNLSWAKSSVFASPANLDL